MNSPLLRSAASSQGQRLKNGRAKKPILEREYGREQALSMAPVLVAQALSRIAGDEIPARLR
jgi:hypothetical protein